MAGRAMTGRARVGGQVNAASPTVTVRIPMRFQTRGGRKAVMATQGQDGSVARPSTAPRADPLLVALARAFYWRKLIETGEGSSIAEIATAEGVSPSYVSRILRLTLLPPAVVLPVVDGEQRTATALSLAWLASRFPMEWRARQAR